MKPLQSLPKPYQPADILDLSKVESGRLEIESAWAEPHRIILEVLQMLGIKAREKGIALKFRALGALPQQIKTDPARFRQIIFNLVGNAIKFTEEGGVMVEILSADRSFWQIVVADTGIGISPEEQEIIFDPFQQVDRSLKRKHSGTGLGLSITKHLVEILGGSIRVVCSALKNL